MLWNLCYVPRAALACACALLTASVLPAEEPIDWEMVNRIRDEGFHRSQVMATLERLSDRIGPRLTGSPGMKEANEWTRAKLAEWGLENARLEPFEFGRGWSFSRTSVHLLKPREMPLLALPEAWTPGTGGPVSGPAVRVEIESEKDLERLRDRSGGKILFLDEPRELLPAEEDPPVDRHDAYFNLDHGSGKIRGVYAQENAAAAAVFEAWLRPFHDLGASSVVTRNTGATDHTAFDRVGLPGFQFIQDRLDYSSRTHHTNVDTLDHAVREDLVQASVVMASFLYHAAMREEPLPRKPMPRYEPRE